MATIAVSVGIAAVTNGALAAFGLNRRDSEIWPAFAPPGHTIGVIWIVLFALMGTARWLVVRGRDASAARNARWIDGLIAMCLAYPFYTHFIGGHAVELAGNIATFSLAAAIVVRLRAEMLAASFVAVVAAWIAFATVLVFALVALNGWRT